MLLCLLLPKDDVIPTNKRKHNTVTFIIATSDVLITTNMVQTYNNATNIVQILHNITNYIKTKYNNIQENKI